MEQKTDILHPSAPLENIDVEQKLETNDVISFNNSFITIKEVITHFKDKNNKSKKIYKKYKMLTIFLKSIDTFVIITTTSICITLRLTGIGLILIPKSTGIGCGLTVSNKVIDETVLQKCDKYKKQYQEDQQTIKSFDKLYRKMLQDNVFDKNEYENLFIVFTKFLDELKSESFL